MDQPLNESLISVQHLSFEYNKNEPILRDISAEIKAGGFIGLTGSNGSGKSTFLQILNGLIPHHIEGKMTGDVFVRGLNTKNSSTAELAKTVGLLFQNPDFSIFNLTVEDEVTFGAKNINLENIDLHVTKALEIAGLNHKKDANPHELSMGQKQRLALACVLAMNCQVIALDEPSSMLDYRSSLDLYDHLKTLQKSGKTVLTIEHDTDYLWRYCTEIWVFDDGEIIAKGSPQQIFSKTEMLNRCGIKIPNMNLLSAD